MIPHQDKTVSIEEGAQAHRLTDLRCFIHNAEVKMPSAEDGVLHAHTGGGHHKLYEGKDRGE